MPDRQRVRVGRQVSYQPTDAEVATVTGRIGEVWPAQIAKVTANTVTLNAIRSNGSAIALPAVVKGQSKGTYSLGVVGV